MTKKTKIFHSKKCKPWIRASDVFPHPHHVIFLSNLYRMSSFSHFRQFFSFSLGVTFAHFSQKRRFSWFCDPVRWKRCSISTVPILGLTKINTRRISVPWVRTFRYPPTLIVRHFLRMMRSIWVQWKNLHSIAELYLYSPTFYPSCPLYSGWPPIRVSGLHWQCERVGWDRSWAWGRSRSGESHVGCCELQSGQH